MCVFWDGRSKTPKCVRRLTGKSSKSAGSNVKGQGLTASSLVGQNYCRWKKNTHYRLRLLSNAFHPPQDAMTWGHLILTSRKHKSPHPVHTHFMTQLKLPGPTPNAVRKQFQGVSLSHTNTHTHLRDLSEQTGAGVVVGELYWVQLLLGGSSALQAAVSGEGPVFSSSSPKRTLPVFTADLNLEDFLVTFLILIGWQVHAWEGSR